MHQEIIKVGMCLIVLLVTVSGVTDLQEGTFVDRWIQYVENEKIIALDDMIYVEHYLKVFDLMAGTRESDINRALIATAKWLEIHDYHTFEDFWTGITLWFIYWSENADEIILWGHFRFTLFKEIFLQEDTEDLSVLGWLGHVYLHLANILHTYDSEQLDIPEESPDWLKKKEDRELLVNERYWAKVKAGFLNDEWPNTIVDFYMDDMWNEEENMLFFYKRLVKFDLKYGTKEYHMRDNFYLSPPLPQFFSARLLLRTMHKDVVKKCGKLGENLNIIEVAECFAGINQMRKYGDTLLYLIAYEESLGTKMLVNELKRKTERAVVLVTEEEYDIMEKVLKSSFETFVKIERSLDSEDSTRSSGNI